MGSSQTLPIGISGLLPVSAEMIGGGTIIGGAVLALGFPLTAAGGAFCGTAYVIKSLWETRITNARIAKDERNSESLQKVIIVISLTVMAGFTAFAKMAYCNDSITPTTCHVMSYVAPFFTFLALAGFGYFFIPWQGEKK